MYYTELDPRDMSPVYVAKTPHEKALQRALLQWGRSEKRQLVIEALERTGRTDLIGYGPECLIRPEKGSKYAFQAAARQAAPKKAQKRDGRGPKPEGTVHRSRKNANGQKGKMSPRKKAAFAKRRAKGKP